MTKCLRLASMAVVLLLTALGAALLQPDWARDLGLESLPRPGGPGDRTARLETPAEVARKVGALDRRIAEKDRLAAEVVGGRLTLLEAAARFRRLNHDDPPAVPLDVYYPGDSEEERLCRQVIAYVGARLRGCDPDVAGGLLAPYEEELRCHKERHGKVILPELPP
jgi:hypothetical protein